MHTLSRSTGDRNACVRHRGAKELDPPTRRQGRLAEQQLRARGPTVGTKGGRRAPPCPREVEGKHVTSLTARSISSRRVRSGRRTHLQSRRPRPGPVTLLSIPQAGDEGGGSRQRATSVRVTPVTHARRACCRSGTLATPPSSLRRAPQCPTSSCRAADERAARG